jgi:hypothetical protein
MWKEKRELKVQMKDQELAQQDVVRNLKKVLFVYSLFNIRKIKSFFNRQMNLIYQNYVMIFFDKLVKLKKNMRKNYVIFGKKWNYVVKQKFMK